MPQHTCSCQRIDCGSQFFPFFLWIPGTEHRFLRIGDKPLHKLSHFTNQFPQFLRQGLAVQNGKASNRWLSTLHFPSSGVTTVSLCVSFGQMFTVSTCTAIVCGDTRKEITEDYSHLISRHAIFVCGLYHIYHKSKAQDMCCDKLSTAINSKKQICGKKSTSVFTPIIFYAVCFYSRHTCLMSFFQVEQPIVSIGRQALINHK